MSFFAKTLSTALAALALTACTSQPMLMPAASRMPSALMAMRAQTNFKPQAVVTISPQEAHDWVMDPQSQWLILDVRTPEEFAQGRLKNATLMNFYDPDFKTKLEDMNRHQPTILYCRSGNRSGKALEIMRELGFKNVYEVRGGILAWQASGFPVVK
ncbi:MAG: rhodanese-like domain-containing protein [Candidatus Sericytochromatia bacterium]